MSSDSRTSRTVVNSACALSRTGRADPNAQLTLGEAIRRNATLHPNRVAILSTSFAPLTYHDLRRQLDEMRTELRQGGFGCSSRIGVLLPSGPEAVLAIVATACSAVAVPLDPRQTSAEFDQRLEALRVDALLVLQSDASEAREAAERRNIPVIEAIPIGESKLGLRLAIPVTALPAPDEEPAPETAAFILQTSGTTAQPKLIPFSHAGMLAAASRLRTWFRLTPEDRCLSVSPPYYSHGLKVTVLTPLLTGGSVAIPANAAVIDLPEWFDALRPTWYSAGPALHRAVLDKARTLPDAAAMHTLRFALSGGAPLPATTREELEEILGIPILEHYGSSEAAQIASNLPPPGLNRPGTCGIPWPGTVAIVGEDGRPLPRGERGEVWVRGPTLIPGYLNDPALNQRAFVDGWLRTGDLGSLDGDGFLSLHGRLNELINRGGEKIAPAEVDCALLRHPAVAEAAAFSVPHPRLGEDIAVAVVLRPGAHVTPMDLRRFLRGELTAFKVPRRVLIRDQLPKGTTGKVQRRRLAADLVAGDARMSLAPGSSASRPPQDLQVELLQLWRRLLRCENLTIDDDFFERGGDSLLAIEMLLEVEKIVGYPLPEAILFEAETIRQLAPRIAERERSSAGPCAFFNTGGSQLPLFFFHDGSSLRVHGLVSLLAPDQPVVAIEPHGARGGRIPQSIEEMAADRLPLVLQQQPFGPYRIAGYCKGALVAFEVARQLAKAGRKVELVGLVDPPTTSARPAMQTILSLVRHVSPSAGAAWLYDQMNRYERLVKKPWRLRWVKVRDLLVTSRAAAAPPLSRLNKAYAAVMARYRPAALAVPVVFYGADFDGRRWSPLSPGLEVVELPGEHSSCIAVGAEILAKDLRQRIATCSRDTVWQR